MDPQANLKEQAEIAQMLIELQDEAGDAGYSMDELSQIAEHAERLAELVQAYCEWISKGGSQN